MSELHMNKQWTDELEEFSNPLTTLNLNGDESVKNEGMNIWKRVYYDNIINRWEH